MLVVPACLGQAREDDEVIDDQRIVTLFLKLKSELRRRNSQSTNRRDGAQENAPRYQKSTRRRR